MSRDDYKDAALAVGRYSAAVERCAHIEAALREVKAPREVRLRFDGERPYLQVQPAGRKWWLSPHMTASEVVRTAFMACLAYEEHELREFFTWRGARVFGPHLDVEALVEVADCEDRRRESRGAWEREPDTYTGRM